MKKKKNTDNEVDDENDKKVIRRTLRLEARVTEQEYAKAAELAKTCGLSMSNYVRRTTLGQHPRQRLSEREVEALCSLTDARGDLIRIAAAVKSIQADKRAMYFSDTRFVEQWMRAATQLINRWSQIPHGANAIRYSVNKDRADIVKANLLPDDISPEAMYGRMMLVQKMFAEKINKGRPLGRNVIRIELSPAEEESRGWSMDDWVRLADEFIRVFDAIDLSGKTKRTSSKQVNLKGSQYIVALHRDSKSGILHLHIDANRVDMDGKINDSHKIGERAVIAANIINEKRGWVQSEEIGIRHRQEITNCCMEILRAMDKFSWRQYEMELTKRGYKVHIQENDKGKVYGYSVKRGNSNYKSSVLGIGRNLTPSKIETTWAKLHLQERKSESTNSIPQQTRTANTDFVIQPKMAPQPVLKHYDIATDEYHSYHVDISEATDNIIIQECSLEEAQPLAKIEEIQHTALLLFAGYLDAATSIVASSGGGGSDTGGWGRDKDEDELEWARRCARMANQMCKRRRRLHR